MRRGAADVRVEPAVPCGARPTVARGDAVWARLAAAPGNAVRGARAGSAVDSWGRRAWRVRQWFSMACRAQPAADGATPCSGVTLPRGCLRSMLGFSEFVSAMEDAEKTPSGFSSFLPFFFLGLW